MRVRLSVLLVIALGGSAGTLLRAWIAQEVPARSATFPWPTLIVNLVGSLILGFVVTPLIGRSTPSRYLRPLLATGFCGGLTTFSTFVVETDLLVRAGRVGLAGGYVVLSVSGGLMAAWLGVVSARSIWRSAS